LKATKVILATLALLMASPGSAIAQRLIHRVRFGETLADISRQYYGAGKHTRLLELTNGFSRGRALQAGERIRIPTAWTYTTAQETSLKELARELLGDARRWPTLRRFNLRLRKDRVKAGTALVVPFILVHTVRQGETFTKISRLYFRSRRFHRLIAQHNFSRARRPQGGAKLEIPIGNLRVNPRRMEAIVNRRLLGIFETPRKHTREALQEANALIRRGDYLEVPLRLIRLLSQGQAADEQLAEAFKLLAITYVALDRNKLATRAFIEALLLNPALQVNPMTTSPKVIKVFKDARGRMKKGKQ